MKQELEKVLEFLINSANGNGKLEINDHVLTISKDEDGIHITACEEDYGEDHDDSETQQIIKDYKETIKSLDDCVFVEAMSDIEKQIEVKKFDDLLNKVHLTEEECSEVESMINISSEIFANHLEEKIKKSIETYLKF